MENNISFQKEKFLTEEFLMFCHKENVTSSRIQVNFLLPG